LRSLGHSTAQPAVEQDHRRNSSGEQDDHRGQQPDIQQAHPPTLPRQLRLDPSVSRNVRIDIPRLTRLTHTGGSATLADHRRCVSGD